MTVNVKVFNRDLTFKKGTTYFDVYKELKDEFVREPMVAKTGTKLRELSSKIKNGDNIEFLDYTNEDGMLIYKRGVSILIVKAIKDILGKDTNIAIEHSIKKNYYCEIRKNGYMNDPCLLKKIEDRMKELVLEDKPIEKVVLSKDDAIAVVRENFMEDKARLFKYRVSSSVTLYKIDELYDYFYGYMPPTTGFLKYFSLVPCERGILMVFPDRNAPEVVPVYDHPEKISSVFMEQMEWCSLMKADTVADLNDLIVRGEFPDLVRINEALHEKKVAEIADMIAKKRDKIKIVLVAGPSSSGKTTFARRLCIQLRVNGIYPHVIGLDDYFINRSLVKRDEFGKLDFENIDSLDVKLFNEDLTKLIQGETVEMPTYNFIKGEREYKGNYKTLKEGEIFIVEGIHGLNPKLTEAIAEENKFKVFISAMTQLNIDNHNRISTSDSRLIRRIVRDFQFRGYDAAGTIDSWPYVKRGEEKNIFPYQENADVIFNSATIYELSVLKSYAMPLLYKITSDMPEYITAKRLIKFLGYFLAVDSKAVPGNSIVQEFLGGSVFDVG